MCARILILLAIVHFSHTLVIADTYPFGDDGLPYLASHSDLIIESGDSKLLAENRTFRMYDVRVTKTLKGTIGNSVRVIVTKALLKLNADGKPVTDGDEVKSAILFLTKPISVASGTSELPTIDGPVRALVSGLFGVVRIQNDSTRVAIDEYLGAKDSTQRIGWARTWASYKDETVQRWAILELQNHQKEFAALTSSAEILTFVIKSDSAPKNQSLAARQLLSLHASAVKAGDKDTKWRVGKALIYTLGNNSLPISLQYQACAALPQSERKEIVHEWIIENKLLADSRPVVSWLSELDTTTTAQQQDALLDQWEIAPNEEKREWAQHFRTCTGMKHHMNAEEIRKLREKLTSGKAVDRSTAIHALCDMGPSSQALGLIADVFESQAASEATRRRLIEVLSQWKSEETVSILHNLAKDKKEATSIRKDAAYAIGRMGKYDPAQAALGSLQKEVVDDAISPTIKVIVDR